MWLSVGSLLLRCDLILFRSGCAPCDYIYSLGLHCRSSSCAKLGVDVVLAEYKHVSDRQPVWHDS